MFALEEQEQEFNPLNCVKMPGEGPESQTLHVVSHMCILASNVHIYVHVQFGVSVEVKKLERVQHPKVWERPSGMRGY